MEGKCALRTECSRFTDCMLYSFEILTTAARGVDDHEPIIQGMRPCHAAMFSELKQPLLRAGSWRPRTIKKISKAREQSDSQVSGSSWILQDSQGPSWDSVGGNGNWELRFAGLLRCPWVPQGAPWIQFPELLGIQSKITGQLRRHPKLLIFEGQNQYKPIQMIQML